MESAIPTTKSIVQPAQAFVKSGGVVAGDEFDSHLPPITRALAGIIDESKFDAAEYRKYQEGKYA
jgi:hypothetical protein